MVLFVLLLAAIAVSSAHACSCMDLGRTGDARVAYAVSNNRHILRGYVSNIRSYVVPGDDAVRGQPRIYQNATVTVLRDYKSSLGGADRIELHTELTFLCGMPLSPGVWLLTPHGSSDEALYYMSQCGISCRVSHTASLCDSTVRSLEGSDEVLAAAAAAASTAPASLRVLLAATLAALLASAAV